MAEKKEQNKAADNASDNRTAEMLSQALAEDIGEIPEAAITIEELKDLEQADRRKRNRKIAKFAAVAAALILVCGVAAFAAGSKMAVPVEADKDTTQTVEEEDGVVVINEGGAEGTGAINRIEEDWGKVADKRKDFPDLIIPSYVPEGYEFVKLDIEQYIDMGYKATYTYDNQKLRLQIEECVYGETGGRSQILANKGKRIKTKHGWGYISQDKNENLSMMTLFGEKKSLKVSGEIAEEECIKIIENVDMP